MSSTSVADFLDTNVLVYSVAFYDSAIVAAALEAGCKHPPSETCSTASVSRVCASRTRFAAVDVDRVLSAACA